MSSEPRYFEDFHIGQRFAFGHYEVTKAEIIAFAKEFDPQPHHLDEEAAKHSMLGGLSASGWHICAMTMRIVVDGVFGKAESRGGAGVEDCRWLKPVRPSDVLRVEAEILELTPHPRKPLGFARMQWNVFNQREQVAMMINTPIFARRDGP